MQTMIIARMARIAANGPAPINSARPSLSTAPVLYKTSQPVAIDRKPTTTRAIPAAIIRAITIQKQLHEQLTWFRFARTDLAPEVGLPLIMQNRLPKTIAQLIFSATASKLKQTPPRRF